MAKLITIRTADADSQLNALVSQSDDTVNAQLRKLASKANTTITMAHAAKVAKTVGYGAIKVAGWWYPVVAGAMVNNSQFTWQHPTAATQYAVLVGEQAGKTFNKSGIEVL